MNKQSAYNEVAKAIAATIDGEPDALARMATTATLLHHAFDGFIWTGFYRVDAAGDGLVIGPYQGQLGCLRIPFGRGVCGAAAAQRETQIVSDVHEFPGHITCDAAAASEIVCPVFDKTGALIAVFDVDSDRVGYFDDVDARHLEAILADGFANG